MHFYLIIFAAALLHPAAKAEEQKLAIDIVLKNGQQVKFPFFDEQIQTIEPSIKDLFDKNIRDIIDYMLPVLDNELDNPGSTSYLNWVKVTKHMLSMSLKQAVKINHHKKEIPRFEDFRKEFATMLIGFMRESKNRAFSIHSESRQELKIRLHNYLETFQEAMQRSPVSAYVKLREGSVDGVPFSRLTVDLMASFRNNGFNKFFKALDKFMHVADHLV